MHVVGVKMADSAPPRAKKKPREVHQFVGYQERNVPNSSRKTKVDSGVPICRLCEHSAGFSRVDSAEDHLKNFETEKFLKVNAETETGKS